MRFHCDAEKDKPRHRTTSFITDLTADLHFSGESDHGYADLVLETGIKRVMDVPGVHSGKGTEDNENLAG